MPLSRIILSCYELLLELSLWLFILICFVGGWQLNGFIGAVGLLIVGFVIAVMSFGLFLTVSEIRRMVKKIESKLKI